MSFSSGSNRLLLNTSDGVACFEIRTADDEKSAPHSTTNGILVLVSGFQSSESGIQRSLGITATKNLVEAFLQKCLTEVKTNIGDGYSYRDFEKDDTALQSVNRCLSIKLEDESALRRFVHCFQRLWNRGSCSHLQISVSHRIDTDTTSDFLQYFSVQPTELPAFHPMYKTRDLPCVIHSLNDVISCLSSIAFLPEVGEALKIAMNLLTGTEPEHRREKQADNRPFVVLEGLDGCGKSTLARGLVQRLEGAVLLETIPALRKAGNRLTPISERARKACFYLNNYALAAQIARLPEGGLAVCDRYWHSSTAYAIAQDCAFGGEESIPPAHHACYQWPTDLRRPDLVLFLQVDDDVRTNRVVDRGDSYTVEEMRLEEKLHLERVLGAYRRFSGEVPFVYIDANSTREEVLSSAVDKLQRIIRG